MRRTPQSIDHGLLDRLHPILARIYAARNVASMVELDRSLERLHPPTPLKGIQRAAALLAAAIKDEKRILVVADFDADGATSCALAMRALRSMGATHVGYVVPNRFEYGYGLTPEIVAIAAQYTPDLLITVDNGISSIDGVRSAHERGIAVLVTDHHLPGDQLPDAEAIVNPNQAGDDFPSKNLAGVGVIFYVMLALRTHLRESGWFSQSGISEPNLAKLLDLVALGTVADLVPLDHNNRILVTQGLARINRNHMCAGIRALLRIARRAPGDIATSDLGFCVAPRLNAAGRLDDMSLGIECLLTDDQQAAQAIAYRLDALNRERRAIEANMQAQAVAVVEGLRLEANDLPKGLCLFDASWHQGIIGLVASRIKERLHRPVIAFAPASESELKGSARSVPGLHIRDALDAVAARQPELLNKFGGHAMAAGLSLKRERLDAFQRAFDQEVSRHLSADDLQGKIMSDGELTADDLNLELATLLRQAGPWGQGFPEPLFDGHFDIIGQRVVADKHLKLTLRCPDQNKLLAAIAFNRVADSTVPDWERTHAAYRLEVNEYRGYRSVQLIIEHMEPAES
ncbi:MAG: single-stranded-DNA-specific exonuclease RecJ [Acidiferrobacterales bacterium]